MEAFDVFSIFISGIALGFIIGHQAYKRLDAKLDYMRGHNDGVNELWPHLVRAWTENLLNSNIPTSTNQTDGGSNGDQRTV
jgi:hypothetical protein